ncbi:MAG: S8 family serine peptidase, partial [bacterium]|nr:S8 family serine peptidase [bacterium]
KHANPSIPMLPNMSIDGQIDPTENAVFNNSVAAGAFYAVAAGNDYGIACDWSPASAADAYTTGATDSGDGQASFSNSGSCVDIHAPGVSILSTYNSSDTATGTMSGTSMASPHVCGGGALVFDEHPTWTPFQVMDEMTARATSGEISPIDAGSPNLLLYTLGGTVVPCTSDPECDDGLFCNGAETCNFGTGQCDAGTDPCLPGETCDEGNDLCTVVVCAQRKEPCSSDADCCAGLSCHHKKFWCK